jgi:hypothetical protein
VCVQVGSVYWLRDTTDAPRYTFTTYGRDPATAVTIDQSAVPPAQVLQDLETAIAVTPSNGHVCTSLEDTTG